MVMCGKSYNLNEMNRFLGHKLPNLTYKETGDLNRYVTNKEALNLCFKSIYFKFRCLQCWKY